MNIIHHEDLEFCPIDIDYVEFNSQLSCDIDFNCQDMLIKQEPILQEIKSERENRFYVQNLGANVNYDGFNVPAEIYVIKKEGIDAKELKIKVEPDDMLSEYINDLQEVPVEYFEQNLNGPMLQSHNVPLKASEKTSCQRTQGYSRFKETRKVLPQEDFSGEISCKRTEGFSQVRASHKLNENLNGESNEVTSCKRTEGFSGTRVNARKINIFKLTEQKSEISIKDDGCSQSISKQMPTKKHYVCHYCGKFCFKKAGLFSHLRKHQEGATNVKKSFETYNNKEKLKETIKSTHRSIHKCRLCDKQFRKMFSLRAHMAVHTKRKLQNYFSPRKPNNKAILNEKLNIQKEKDADQKVVQRKNNISNSNNKSKVYEKLKEPTVSYKCSHCKKLFRFQSSITNHIQLHSGNAKKCSICNESFAMTGTLIRHLKKHENERSFKCSICSKAFFEIYNLTFHMKFHRKDEKPKHCQHCYMPFDSKMTGKEISQHLRIHNGKKHYKCSICSASFGTKLLFIKHMQNHTDETLPEVEIKDEDKAVLENQENKMYTVLYSCKVCLENFNDKNSFMIHAKIHESSTL